MTVDFCVRFPPPLSMIKHQTTTFRERYRLYSQNKSNIANPLLHVFVTVKTDVQPTTSRCVLQNLQKAYVQLSKINHSAATGTQTHDLLRTESQGHNRKVLPININNSYMDVFLTSSRREATASFFT